MGSPYPSGSEKVDMKLTKLDKNAYWWKGTRTAWWYKDEDGWCWIINNKNKENKEDIKKDMKIPQRNHERSSSHSLKFHLAICLSSAIGVLLAFLAARLFLL